MIVACDDQFVIDGFEKSQYPDVLRSMKRLATSMMHGYQQHSSLTKQKADRFFSEIDRGCNDVVGSGRHAHYDSNHFVYKPEVISIRR